MPSLTDIPEHLLKEENSGLFLEWLIEQPIDITVARELMSKYAKTLGVPFTAEDYTMIKDHFEPVDDV